MGNFNFNCNYSKRLLLRLSTTPRTAYKAVIWRTVSFCCCVNSWRRGGVVPAKKHVCREYITIKSHPMDDCRWKSTLSFLIRIQELFRQIFTYGDQNVCTQNRQFFWTVVSLVGEQPPPQMIATHTQAILLLQLKISRIRFLLFIFIVILVTTLVFGLCAMCMQRVLCGHVMIF